MKRLIMGMAVLLTGWLIFQATASAETLQGQIISVDSTAHSLTLSRLDPATGSEEEVTISVPDKAKLKGIGSLSELKPGDQVKVDASGSGENMEAKSLEVMGGTGAQPQPTGGAGQPPVGGGY